MPSMEVLNWEGARASNIQIKEVFFTEKPTLPLIKEAVVWQSARKRKGNHNVKTRGQVRGGGRKPFRQKGTGNARQGSIRSPLLRGGGVIHGPKKRSYDYSLPKKIRRKALMNAFCLLFQEKRLIFIEDMKSPDGKTKTLNSRFQKMGWSKALLADQQLEENFKRACKNLRSFKYIPAEGLNVYDMLKFNFLVLTPGLLPEIYRRCGVS